MRRPARTLVGGHAEVPVSDREFPGLAGSSGTERARGKVGLPAWEAVRFSLHVA